jgi:hypothetical protein
LAVGGAEKLLASLLAFRMLHHDIGDPRYDQACQQVSRIIASLFLHVIHFSTDKK